MRIIQRIRERRARVRAEAEKQRRRDKEVDELGDFLFSYIRRAIQSLGDEGGADA